MFNFHHKGKTHANSSYLSSTFSNNLNSNPQTSGFDPPDPSMYYQTSRRGSYDNSVGGTNFSGFFSPANPGNFYSFEQPIVFNSISNINLPQKKKKTKQNAHSRQQYLDTIREVYKPRYNKTQEFQDNLQKGYLQGGLSTTKKESHLPQSYSRFKKDGNMRMEEENNEVQESGNESVEEGKGAVQERVKKKIPLKQEMFQKENFKKKYFLLPEIERKNISGSVERDRSSGSAKGSSFRVKSNLADKLQKNISYHNKNSDKLDGNKSSNESNDYELPSRKRSVPIISTSTLGKTSMIDEPKVEYGMTFKKANQPTEFVTNIEKDISKISDRKTIEDNYNIVIPAEIRRQNEQIDFLMNSDERSNHETKSTNELTKFTPTSNQTEPKMFNNPFRVVPSLIDASPNFSYSGKNLLSPRTPDTMTNLDQVPWKEEKNIKENWNERKEPKKIPNGKDEREGIGVPVILTETKSNNNVFTFPTEETKNEAPFIMIQKERLPEKTITSPESPSYQSQISLESPPKVTNQNTDKDSIPQINMPFSNETIVKINLQSQNSMTTPLNLLESIQSPRTEQSDSEKDENEETPLSTPPKLKLNRPPSIHIKKDKTKRSSTEAGKHLSPPSKSSSFRRGTNTSGIENSFSFMKKILDDPDNDHDYEHESKQNLESSKLLVLKHCDSLSGNNKPTNANRTDLKINFSQKNISYQRKKHFTENSKTTKRQKSKSFTAKFSTHFRKKTNKFLKLLTNLLISFRNSGDETNSFIFTESRFQGDEKPILNLKEILRKKTIEEQNSTTKSSKRIALQRSGTFMSEKYNNSAFSFASSPKTDLSKDVKDLNNSIFFINVHPPTKEDIIMESAENFEDTRQKRKESDELDIIKRRTEEMRLNVEDEQQKLIKIQFFLAKKLWKLSLGILISNYKLLLINEKGFLFQNIPKHSMGFDKTSNIRMDSQKLIREKKESNNLFKFSLEQLPFKERKFEHHEEEVEIMKRSAETEGNLSPPIEDESYEEVFEQDGGFIEDLKKTECNTHLKFSYQAKLDVDLEPLLMRKKANNFLKFLPEVAIPISTSLEHSFLDSNIPPNYNTDLEILDSSFFTIKDMNCMYARINKSSHDNAQALIGFYRMHYESFFSSNGDFEDQINIPVFEEEIKSPTMRFHHPSPKHHTVHLTSIISKESLSGLSPMMKSERYNKTEESPKKEEFQLSPKKLSKIGLKVHKEAILNKTKSEKLFMRKSMEKEMSFAGLKEEKEDEEEEEKIGEKRKFIRVPKRNIRTQTTLSENATPNNLKDLNASILNPLELTKDDKKLSFSNMESSKTLAKKDSGKDNRELVAFKFINNIRKNKEKHLTTKLFKSSKNLLSETEMKSVENNYKMDKSSLFFRNQLIGINKMKTMHPVDQMFWAIKHNNIHKIEELFLMYPSMMLDSRDEDNNSFLTLTAQIGNFEIVCLFLLKGVNVNLQNVFFIKIINIISKNDGNTALHLALSYNNDAIVDKLIAFGAQENIKNNEGKTAWDMYSKK